jgi:hypothetical protein
MTLMATVVAQMTDENHPILVHYHHAPWIWATFIVALLLHSLLNVDDIARKTLRSRAAVFEDAWIRIFYRWGFCIGFFGLLWLYPEILTKLFGIFGIQIGGDESAVFSLPMNIPLALLYGLVSDSILGYIPILKNQLPPISDASTIEVKQTTTATKLDSSKKGES